MLKVINMRKKTVENQKRGSRGVKKINLALDSSWLQDLVMESPHCASPSENRKQRILQTLILLLPSGGFA